MNSSTFNLKLRTKNGNMELRDLVNSKMSLSELQNIVSKAVNIPSSNLKILFGYPRKILNLSTTESIEQAGIKAGDTLFVEENCDSNKELSVNPTGYEDTESTKKSVPVDEKPHISENISKDVKGILLKKEVPSDNSCLFTSLGFVLSGKIDLTVSSYMRRLVADKIASQSEEYSDAILGKPNKEYCSWILNPNSWGGAIELAVLSDHYGFEIAVVNSMTGVISRFGEDKRYDHRVFLLFDGIHYDPLYMDFSETDNIQTIFPTSDDEVLREAERLAVEAKESRQFTDVNQFMVCCTICNSILVGQAEAQKHAEQTGHTKFDEVSK